MIKVYKYGEVSNDEIFSRAVMPSNVEQTVADIIADVRQNGDAALLKYNEKFDGAVMTSVEVTEEELDDAI